ncbi:mmuM [Symbiodinium natans]|uniref:MmuM protein n=1 Tax=Symbiodinium natans TaxID=878477 RepID=A0A812UBC9_9DINO|nr:mmuM [Symbiodinium natans]
MGQELKARKAAGDDVAYSLDLFSTASLLETPHAVAQLHEDYIKAGATVITTASYAVTRFYLDKIGEASRVKELNELCVALAKQAIAKTDSAASVSVAGCVPPLSESYRADLVPQDKQLREEYAEIIDSLMGSDIFLCETMSSMREAAVAVPMCVAKGKPTWASFTLKHDKKDRLCIPDGTDVEAVVKQTVAMGVEAVLFNCCAPELIAEALPKASAALNGSPSYIRLGGYGNAWEECDRDHWTIDQNESHVGANDHGAHGMVVRDLCEAHYVEQVQDWLRSGASIVGGCCGISPAHIQAIRDLQECTERQ